jgi:predicted SprT family Zn-dependent metalloprotease
MAQNEDMRAHGAVRRLATRKAIGGVLGGVVPTEVINFLYSHARPLGRLIEKTVGVPCPTVNISVEKIAVKQYGHYKLGRDGLGLKDRVVMNVMHLGESKRFVLHVLLHEALHAAEHLAGKGTKQGHDARFRGWAEALGVPCDAGGHTTGITKGSPFTDYLEAAKVPDEPLMRVARKMKPAGSPLKKWSCQCEKPVNVRVAVENFDATCNACGEKFEKAE